MSRRALLLLLVFVAVAAGVALAIGFLGGQSTAGTCQASRAGTDYHVTIQNGKASLTAIRGHVCDTLTFTNKDSAVREIAFGPHEKHVPYDGVAERVLTKNESFTITFNKTGSYRWHDHLHDEITGTFTVAE